MSGGGLGTKSDLTFGVMASMRLQTLWSAFSCLFNNRQWMAFTIVFAIITILTFFFMKNLFLSRGSATDDNKSRVLSLPVLDRNGRLVGLKMMSDTERDALTRDVTRTALTSRQKKWAEKLYWRWAKATLGQTLEAWIKGLEYVEHPHNALVMFGRMEKVANKV